MYPQVAINSLTQPVDLYDTSVGGTTCAQMLARVGDVNGLFGKHSPQAASILCGANDATGGIAASTSMANIASWVSSVKAAGYTNVFVCTMLSETGQDTFKNTLNGLIRSNAAADGYTVIDFGADSHMGCDGCSTNSTYFQDGKHPTQTGQNILGGLMLTALQAVGFN